MKRYRFGSQIGSFLCLAVGHCLVTADRTVADDDAQRITIEVTDAAGRPIAGASTGILAGYHNWGPELTDEDGRAVHALPQDETPQMLYAFKAGKGIEYRTLRDPRIAQQGPPPEEIDLSKPLTFVLSDPITVDVKLINAETGAPIPHTIVRPWLLKKPGEAGMLNLSLITGEIAATTDAAGVARFDWLPSWNASITFLPSNPDFVRQRGTYEPANVSGSLTIELHKPVSLSGTVRLPNGEPAADITVQAIGEGYTFDGFRGSVKTDREGAYEINVAPNLIYLLVVDDREWAAAPQTGFAVRPSQPRDDLDFDLRPATRVFGRVTVGPDDVPVAGQSIQSYQSGADLHNAEGLTLPNPENSQRWVQPHFVRVTKTDKDGCFELFVGPGDYDLRGPTQTETVKFTITDEVEREFNFHAPRPENGRLTGLVVSGDPPQPVPQARVTGIYRHQIARRDLSITADAEGRFDVERELHRTVMYARSPDGSMAGVVEIGPDDEQVTIPISPMASATGTLIDAVTGEPLPGREIVYDVHVHRGDDNAPWRPSFGGKTTTAADGSFHLEGLVVGQPYHFSVTNEDGRSWRQIHEYRPEIAAEVEFGELPLAPPYHPPTLHDRIAEAFTGPDKSAHERYDAVLRDARLGTLRVLLILGDPDNQETEELFNARYEDRDVRTILYDYRALALPTTGDRAASTMRLAAELGINIDDDRQTPLLVVLSGEGDRLASASLDEFRSGETLDTEKLVAFFEQHRLPPRDAQQLLQEALAQARSENKRVFVQETASWCGPCWLLSRFIDDHRDIFGKDFIHVKVDHRWTHADTVMDAIEPNDRGGIPWFAILDADGTVLADSNGPVGNIGYPGAREPQGIQHFITMLRKSAIRLTESDLASLEEALKSR